MAIKWAACVKVESLTVALLPFVREDRLQSALGVVLAHPHHCIATDIKGHTHFGLGPTLGQLEQNVGAGQRTSVGTAPMDKSLERSTISFGQG